MEIDTPIESKQKNKTKTYNYEGVWGEEEGERE